MIGAVLAGGRGSRFGRASKPAALLAGRPLASYPVDALGAVCDRVAVVCKRGTELPDLNGFQVAARLTSNGSSPDVVLVSSRDGSDYGPLVLESGARGFIPKGELSGARLAALIA